MANFSIGDVAFTGPRMLRERPVLLAWWGGAHLLFSLVVTLILVGVAGPALSALQSHAHGAPPDRAAAMQSFGAILPAYGLMLLIMLAVYAVFYAAMNRAVLQPADDRFGYLRLGRDELRQAGLFVLLGLIWFASYIALVILAVILMMVTGGAALFAHTGTPPAAPAVLGLLVCFLAGLALAAFVNARLCLASPITFATGRISLSESWKMTKGRFWPLLGTALVVIFIMFIVQLILLIVLGVLTMALAGGGGFASLFHADMSSIGAYFSALRVIQLVLGAIVSAALLPLWAMPPAAIYKQVSGGAADREHLQDVFA